MPRVLVIGGSGLVGRALMGAWEASGAAVAATHRSHPFSGSVPLDLRDPGQIREVFASAKPELVALPAANPHVDDCELHPHENRKINVEGTRNVAQACAQAGASLLFFSTDYVFDGRKGADYQEEDAPHPLSEYGRQKLEAEAMILSLSSRNIVVRTSAVYGWQDVPKNFVLQVVSRLASGQPVKAAVDVLYNPTNADNLAEVCVRLATAGAHGVYHVAGSERVSRHEFARRIAAAFGYDAATVVAAKASDFKQPAARPALSSLSSAKAVGLTGCEIWGVDRGLAEMRRGEAAWRRRWTGVSPAA